MNRILTLLICYSLTILSSYAQRIGGTSASATGPAASVNPVTAPPGATVPKPAFTILFDQSGQLHGFLPQKLMFTDILAFNVTGKDLFGEEQKLLVERAKLGIKRINEIEADPVLMQTLLDVYKIDKAALDLVSADYAKITLTSQQTSAYIPLIDKTNNYYHVNTFNTAKKDQITMQANQLTPFANDCTLLFSDQSDLNISLIRVSLFRKAAFDWLATNEPNFKQPVTAAQFKNLNELEGEFASLSKSINDIIANAPNSTSTLAAINEYNTQVSKLDNTAKSLVGKIVSAIDLSADKNWILNWYWYQKDAMPSLNPFPFFQNKDIIPDTSALTALRLKMSYYQALVKNAGTSTSVSINSVNGYIQKVDSCNTAILSRLKDFQNSNSLQTTNKMLTDSFATTSSILNKIVLITSSGDKDRPLFWMRHHNAANQGEEMVDKPQKEYTQDDRVVILTHNLLYNQQSNIQLAYQPVAVDQSQLADLLSTSIAGLSSVKALGVGTTRNTSNTNITNAYTQTTQNIDKLKNDLKRLVALDLEVQYVLKQKNPQTYLTELTDTAAVYHTQKELTPIVLDSQTAKYTVSISQTQPAASAAAPAQSKASGSAGLTVTATATTAPAAVTAATSPASGTTAKSTNPVDTFRYRVNKLYRIYPMAGIAFTLNNFVSVGPNASGTGSGLITSQPQSHYIGGIKIFLQKTDIRNTSFMFDNDEHGNSLALTRTHFDLAVDLGTPLNNIYTGFGVDPVPGAAINFGVVWNRYSYYEYSGGLQTVNRSLYRPGFYIGLSTDAALVAQIVKLFK